MLPGSLPPPELAAPLEGAATWAPESLELLGALHVFLHEPSRWHELPSFANPPKRRNSKLSDDGNTGKKLASIPYLHFRFQPAENSPRLNQGITI